MNFWRFYTWINRFEAFLDTSYILHKLPYFVSILLLTSTGKQASLIMQSMWIIIIHWYYIPKKMVCLYIIDIITRDGQVCFSTPLYTVRKKKLVVKNFGEFGELVKICQSCFANLQGYHINISAACYRIATLTRLAPG